MSRKYKTSFKREMVESVKQVIEHILRTAPKTDDDRLHFAVLSEIRDRLYSKLGNYQDDYTISFTPSQAFALRILYTDYFNDPTTYLGNKLHQIATEVYKQFN